MPPALQLVCLGPATARLDGREPPGDVLWRKHLALLIYLALSPDRTRTRDHLLALLWPEKTEALARHSLNEAIRRLRVSLGAERLLSVGEAITLSDEALEVDALRFEALATSDAPAALGLLRGDLLEGFHLDDAPTFEEWAAGQRSRVRQRGVALLVESGEAALATSRFAEAEDLARRALALEPFAERAVRLLMRAAGLAGDTAGALAAFAAFAAHLAGELGEQASPDLLALRDRLRHGGWRRAAPAAGDAQPPLVGRARAHGAAYAVCAAALERGPRTLAIVGDPGMGKSRLAAECLDRLALEGATVALARPLVSDHDAPWSTLRMLFRAGLAQALGVAATDPVALAVLAAHIPELRDRAPAAATPDAAQVAAALASLLRAVTDEGPLALAVDDAHWADGPTLEVVQAAVGQLSGVPLALLVTAHDAPDEAPPALLRFRGEVGRGLPGDTVRLEPLSEEDLRALVEACAPWCTEDGARRRLARRLAFETGGNPFLAVTLLRGLEEAEGLRAELLHWPPARATLETPLPIPVPPLARLAIALRVKAADQAAARVLAVASVAGPAIDLELVAVLTALPGAEVARHLEHLERRHLVTFDGERYAFAAPLVAQVVRTDFLTPGEARRLGAAAAAALATRDDLESRLLRAELLGQVARAPEALPLALDIARAAAERRMTRTTRRALNIAAEAANAVGAAERAAVDALRNELAS